MTVERSGIDRHVTRAGGTAIGDGKGNPKWVKGGPSPNPGGRPVPKPWRDALLLAIKEKDQDIDNLTLIARACVTAAKSGDMIAIKEIGDRLDGKPKQQVDLEVKDTTHEERLSFIEALAAETAEENGASPTIN